MPAPDNVMIFLHLSLFIHFTIPFRVTWSKTFSTDTGASVGSYNPSFWAKYRLIESTSKSLILAPRLSIGFGGTECSTDSSPEIQQYFSINISLLYKVTYIQIKLTFTLSRWCISGHFTKILQIMTPNLCALWPQFYWQPVVHFWKWLPITSCQCQSSILFLSPLILLYY